VTEGAGSAEAFKELERAGWDARVGTYDCLTGRITDRLVEPLLDAAGVGAGMEVLDVGTGPGYAAQRAFQRGAVATGVDIAAEVLALARRRHPGIRFLQGDAEDLPFADSSFDAVVSHFTVNHLPQPERAVTELARVLAPGGGVALSAWDVPERSRFLGIMREALRACGVAPAPGVPAGPDPDRFADDGEFARLLRNAGLDGVEVRSVSLTHRVLDGEELWEGLLGGSVRGAGLIMAQPPPTQARIRAEVERLAEQYRADGGLDIPADAKIASGRKA
jgi:SAM-dependent methyltransferase